MIDTCIGIDPGPMTGMSFLDYVSGHLVGKTLLQCDGASAPVILKSMLYANYGDRNMHAVPVYGRKVAALEKFVTGTSAGSRGKAADVTRELVFELAEVLQAFGYRAAIRPAADVKPWATDKRLVAAQVIPSEKGMRTEFRHAYDAARHCLYGAWQAGAVQDPLTRGRA